MNIPPYLKKGDTIAITCPAGFLERSKTAAAIQTLQSWGLQVVTGKTVGKETGNYFAGTDKERLEELQGFMDDSGIHAILMGRGGYGMSRIIDQLDFTRFRKAPKWVCGFSDITLLHNHLQAKLKIASMHTPMCAGFIRKDTFDNTKIIDAFRKSLFGKGKITFPVSPDSHNRTGKARGILVGGNMAMVAHAIGSVSELNTKDCILFMEDIGEHLYKLDRMMIQLKRAGMLDRVRGVVFGQFSDIEDTGRPFGAGLEELLMEHIAAFDCPVCFHFPAGHEDENYPLKLGVAYELTVTGKKVSLAEI